MVTVGMGKKTAANLGSEAKLWLAADNLRSNMDVEMLAPYHGRLYDPACGSGGMFVQCEKFVELHGGRIGDIAIDGQESNPTPRRLAMMNHAIRSNLQALGFSGDPTEVAVS